MIIAVILLSLPLTAQEKTNSSQNDFTDQIKTSLIPLKTINANENMQDLAPLAEILKNKRFIGMGESTHGTQEFYQIKHRLFKFLVQKLDFTVLMLETPPQYTRPLNEYIKNGKGDIKAFYSSYIQTKETIALVEWMKNYNANVSKDKMLSIASFDLG